ncbi:MAG: T9SS type A sorting domain-containing protein [Candidatus Cloacimonetes bacterium]|nr:T9SS type A sorting domain-containing protein [Candidatus Cloacimonadota bacterium]
MTRLFWIVLVMLSCAFLFAQIEYERVGIFPSENGLIQFCDLDNDGVEEMITQSETSIEIFDRNLQLIALFSKSNLITLNETDEELSSTRPFVLSMYHQNGVDYLIVAYSTSIPQPSYWEPETRIVQINIDIFTYPNMSLIEHYSESGGHSNDYDFHCNDSSSWFKNMTIFNDRCYLGVRWHHSESGICSGSSSSNTTKMHIYDLSNIGTLPLERQHRIQYAGLKTCFLDNLSQQVISLDYTEESSELDEYHSHSQTIKLNEVTFALQEEIYSYYGDYYGLSVPLSAGITPVRISPYNKFPILYNIIRFINLDREEFNMCRFSETGEGIEYQRTIIASEIVKAFAHYTELFGGELILASAVIDSQSILRIYSYSDGVVRLEMPLTIEINGYWEPGDGNLYLFENNTLYRIVNITVDNDDNAIPKPKYYLTNYPNPFNPVTTFSYNLAEPSKVSLKIYNVKGQLVKSLVNKSQKAGTFEVLWNGTDSNGKAVGSGVYLYKLVTNKQIQTGKAVLLK